MNRLDLLRDIVRLARVEESVEHTERAAVREVREHLEDILDGTARPSEAAAILGVSRPALKKWLDAGEIGSVLTPKGRREVPIRQLTQLAKEVDSERARGATRALSAVLRRHRREADELDVGALLRRRNARTHRQPELQSLAYHRLVAKRLSPELVEDARRRLDRMQEAGVINRYWGDQWSALLERPLAQIAKRISSDSVSARELRQTSPFTGAVSEHERRRIIEAVEARR